MMLNQLWNRKKFEDSLEWTHAIDNNTIFMGLAYSPYRCKIDASERRLFAYSRLSPGTSQTLDELLGVSLVIGASGAARAGFKSRIRFNNYR